MTRYRFWLLAVLFVVGCRATPSEKGSSSVAPTDAAIDANGFSAATQATIDANARFAASLPLDEAKDFEEATRGLIATEPDVEVKLPDGKTWSPKLFSFVTGDAPATVNPSLWRQALLNGNHGLFQVAEGIYQVRGYDVSNMTWIRGKTGWIVVDPLTSIETATAAAALARRHLGNDPVTAVIFTHSHFDHFAGARAVLPREGSPPARVVAPLRFTEEATSENILAGAAMGRRATYQFGSNLPYGPRGYVDTGLGKQPITATSSLTMPTDDIRQTPQELTLDGVRFVFQYTPDSEAPAELAFYLPDSKAYCGAEIANRTMHNLYTLRGAKVRDALKWSGYLDDAVQRFPDMEIVFTSHTWPTFGRERSLAYLKGQRDTYRYIHDQTLRLANQGFTPREIAEQLELPPQLARNFANRGYYGTLRHNSKAVYQFYFGWYDGNPANLDPLPPVELGKQYVDAMGGVDGVMEKARSSFERGEYRWTATLLDHLVFAAPDHAEARALLARTYDQLGYQSESGVWRAVYLSGANELRHGVPAVKPSIGPIRGLLDHIPLDLFFTAMAARLNGPKAAAQEPLILNFVFTDAGETHVLELENAVLHHRKRDEPAPNAAATVRLTRDLFVRLGTKEVGLRELIFSDELDIDGSRTALFSFFRLLDDIETNFAIVTP